MLSREQTLIFPCSGAKNETVLNLERVWLFESAYSRISMQVRETRSMPKTQEEIVILFLLSLYFSACLDLPKYFKVIFAS